MDKEPIEAKETLPVTFEELLEMSLNEFRKSLGLPPKPKVVEADKSADEHLVQPSNVIKDTEENNG